MLLVIILKTRENLQMWYIQTEQVLLETIAVSTNTRTKIYYYTGTIITEAPKHTKTCFYAYQLILSVCYSNLVDVTYVSSFSHDSKQGSLFDVKNSELSKNHRILQVSKSRLATRREGAWVYFAIILQAS